MSLRINYNSAALQATRHLSTSDNALSKSIERLSSGFKINNAGDDPAGLVISEKLRAQVSGLGQAISNAGDAVNMVKTAEGALSEVHRLLRSMRDLAVHAANTGATDSASVAADQAQISSAISSINKIASETQFGNKKLLDGSAGISSTVTGSSVISADFSKSTITANDTFSVNVTTAAAKAQITGSVALAADLSAETIVINGVSIQGGANSAATLASINAESNETGVTAANVGGFLQLTQKEYGSAARIDVTGGTDIFGSASAAGIGTNAAATVTNAAAGNISDASWTAGNGNTLEDSLGNTIQLVDGTTAGDKAAQGSITVGTLTFQVGAYAGQTRNVSISSVATTNLGTGVDSTYSSIATIDVGANASKAIEVLDQAITDISNVRANLGATQKNVLESSINSLTVAKENIGASESTIRDTDMAAEMAEFTKNQILEQAGTAMLSQANQIPQNLLSLLR